MRDVPPYVILSLGLHGNHSVTKIHTFTHTYIRTYRWSAWNHAFGLFKCKNVTIILTSHRMWLQALFILYILETMDEALAGHSNVCRCQVESHKMFFFSHFMSDVEWKFSRVLMLLYNYCGDANFKWKLDRNYAAVCPMMWVNALNGSHFIRI